MNNQYFKKKEEKIVEKKDNNLYGICFHKTEALEKIYKMSGKLAKNNEFQVHYISLIGKYEVGKERVYISIPLIYYNYKQEVSGASIKFNLVDVGEINKECMPLAISMANEIVDKLNEVIPFNVTWKIEGLQSIHRHP